MEPQVSIVIPSFNGQNLLAKHLPAVIAACKYWDKTNKHWKIVVVDDASTDNTVNWLNQSYPQVSLIKNLTNLRFAQSVNRGVNAALGDIIILLNNDVRPEKDFIAPLVSHFSNRQVFAVGCLEENLESGQKIKGGRGIGFFSRGLLMHRRAKDQNQTKTLWVAAGSGAFSKRIWQRLGGLDPLFKPAYEEDRDICYNALKSGYKLIFESKAKVIHIHETSNLKVFGKTKIKLMSFKNQILFVWKNISSSKLIFKHLLWLPYHLIVTSLKSKGIFFLSFIWALSQLPQAIASRKKIKPLWVKSDEQILSENQ